MEPPHRLRRMIGRDRSEQHRASAPLELLYDLTVVVAISLSGSQLAHLLQAGHFLNGALAFVFSMFGILWAWVNYSWFASAFDTDDWAMRLATLVQMVGVLVLGLGQAPLFTGLEEGRIDVAVLVAGYVVMRVSMVFLWWRVARHSPQHRHTAMAYIRFIVMAQVAWVLVPVLDLQFRLAIVLVLIAFGLEIGGLWYAEARAGSRAHRGGRSHPVTGGDAVEPPQVGTPWHPHHIADRYGGLAIITFGEVVLGTTTAIDALVSRQGWSLDAAVVAVAGVALAFGLWWCYFALPWGEVLAKRPEKSFGFGYGHFFLYVGIAAIGAGLHVAAYLVEGEAAIGELATVLTIAVPVAIVVTAIFAFSRYLLPGREALHWVLGGLACLVLLIAAVMAAVDVPIAWCLIVLMLSPWVVVVGYEATGYRHITSHLAAL